MFRVSLQPLSLALHAPSKIRHAEKFLASSSVPYKEGCENDEVLMSGQKTSPRDPSDESVVNKLNEMEESRIQKITDTIYEVKTKQNWKVTVALFKSTWIRIFILAYGLLLGFFFCCPYLS